MMWCLIDGSSSYDSTDLTDLTDSKDSNNSADSTQSKGSNAHMDVGVTCVIIIMMILYITCR